MKIRDVNAHLHTPYSFSAFASIEQAVSLAVDEGVSVVGINDFYSTEGYEQWKSAAEAKRLYPLFGIEFIALDAERQSAGVRVNDPSNPGRTYLSGKGLRCPARMSDSSSEAIEVVRRESNRQTRQMTDRLNELLATLDGRPKLDFDSIRDTMTKGLVRERHLAKALRECVLESCKGDEALVVEMLTKLCGKAPKADFRNMAATENELRANLLKSGGKAFVAEDEKAFMSVDKVCKIILDAGGLPTYPFLGDDAKGGFTDFEVDVERAADSLIERGIWSAEFITTRNTTATLLRYSEALVARGMVVTFGSEHNTPAMESLLLSVRGGERLNERLRRISYEGACIVAAHQERVAHGQNGFVDALSGRCTGSRKEFVEQGDELINNICK